MPLRHDIRRGATLMVISHALFTGMSALVKLLGDTIPVAELMFFRSALALPVVAVILARGPGGILRGLRTRRLPGHALRACTGTAAQACSFYALTVLPLAVQTALGYTTPLFVTVLAILFLGERVGAHRWSAVVAGFCGVLVIAAGQGVFSPAALAGGRAWRRRWRRGCSRRRRRCWCASSPPPRAARPSPCTSRC
jgi:drug/metabolite transporter (DMT)-like permease